MIKMEIFSCWFLLLTLILTGYGSNAQSCDKLNRVCGCYDGGCWSYSTANETQGAPWCYTQILGESRPAFNWKLCKADGECDKQMTCGSASRYSRFMNRTEEDKLSKISALGDLPSVTYISANHTPNLIVALTSSGDVFQYLSCGWLRLDLPSPIKLVSSSVDNTIVAVTNQNKILIANAGNQAIGQSFHGMSFSTINSGGRNILAISPFIFSTAYVTANDGSLFKLQGGGWTQIAWTGTPAEPMTAISTGWSVTGFPALYVLNAGAIQNVFVFNGRTWESLPGLLSSIDYYSRSRVAGIAKSGETVMWDEDAGKWVVKAPAGKCTGISVSKDQLVCVNKDQRIEVLHV